VQSRLGKIFHRPELTVRHNLTSPRSARHALNRTCVLLVRSDHAHNGSSLYSKLSSSADLPFQTPHLRTHHTRPQGTHCSSVHNPNWPTLTGLKRHTSSSRLQLGSMRQGVRPLLLQLHTRPQVMDICTHIHTPTICNRH
jgi:hypothetical protein